MTKIMSAWSFDNNSFQIVHCKINIKLLENMVEFKATIIYFTSDTIVRANVCSQSSNEVFVTKM